MGAAFASTYHDILCSWTTPVAPGPSPLHPFSLFFFFFSPRSKIFETRIFRFISDLSFSRSTRFSLLPFFLSFSFSSYLGRCENVYTVFNCAETESFFWMVAVSRCDGGWFSGGGEGIRATNAEIEAARMKNEIRGNLKGEFIMRPDRGFRVERVIMGAVRGVVVGCSRWMKRNFKPASGSGGSAVRWWILTR